MNEKKGKFIVVEGLEGAGKSTGIKVIGEVLLENKLNFINTREPGGTPFAEICRDLVKYPDRYTSIKEEITTQSELALMYVSRSQLVHNVIKPNLEKNIWVIGDRHDDSSRAYQGKGRELGYDILTQMRKIMIGDFMPDHTIYMDIDPVLGLERARGRGELDRIEKAGLEFFKRAREGFWDQVNARPDMYSVIDASKSLDEVSLDIKSSVSKYLNSL